MPRGFYLTAVKLSSDQLLGAECHSLINSNRLLFQTSHG